MQLFARQDTLDWHLDELHIPFTEVQFLIRTPSSQLQVGYCLLLNLAENLDLLDVSDPVLVSSEGQWSGTCRIVGISVYVNLKSGLAYRNVCPRKEL